MTEPFSLLLIHLLATVAKLIGPGGIKGIIAENLLLKQQLLVLCRLRQRAPNLYLTDQFLFGFFSLSLGPGRIAKTAVGVQPSTLLRFHDYLVRRKCWALYSPHHRGSRPINAGSVYAVNRTMSSEHQMFVSLCTNRLRDYVRIGFAE